LETLRSKKDLLIKKLISEGILKRPECVEAMLKVPREEFVPPQLRENAYIDSPLPSIGGQTISAPHMVAIMCELLDLSPGLKVLEVGAGTGYHAAVCAEIVAPHSVDVMRRGHVYAVELVRELAEFASANIKRTGYADRVTIIEGDGTLGLPSQSPFDRILVTAAAPRIPPPLKEQLADGGKLVIPVGDAYSVQDLIVAIKKGSDLQECTYGGCVFVPLYGRYGWQ